MFLKELYAKIHRNGIYNGSAFCVTTTHRVLEIMLFNKVIVNIKALAMTPDQVVELLRTGTFKDINIMPKESALPIISESFFSKFFPLSVNHLFDPNWMSIVYAVRMLEILDLLGKSSTGPGPSYELLRNTLLEKCPGLSLIRDTLLQRIEALEYTMGISLPSPKDAPPLKEHQLLSWGLSRTTSKDPLMRAFVRYFAFWGELSPAYSTVLVREDKSADRKPGIGSITQEGFSQYQGATLYRGLDKIGKLQLVEDRKGSYMSPEARLAASGGNAHKASVELMVSPADLGAIGIRNGEVVPCLFE